LPTVSEPALTTPDTFQSSSGAASMSAIAIPF
jgi:hypothetical protein